MEELTSRPLNAIRVRERKPVWNVRLKPYDLIAVRFTSPNVDVQRVELKRDEQVFAALRKRLDDVSVRIASLKDMSLPQLPNHDFESADVGIPNWSLDAAPMTTATLDRQVAHQSRQSLRISSRGQRIAITSEPFTSNKAGRRWLSAFLRSSGTASNARVRIVLEWEVDGERDSRPFRLRNSDLSAGFKNFLFPLDEVPDRASDLQVRVELNGRGTLWIDDVRFLLFRQKEPNQLTKIRAFAYRQLEQNRPDECYRQLVGYWPRFLLQHVTPSPAAQQRLAARTKTQSTPSKPTDKPPEKKKSVLERTRNALFPLRVFDR